jgi:hypothetical protein
MPITRKRRPRPFAVNVLIASDRGLTESFRDYVAGFKKIRLHLKDIEWLTATLLYGCWLLCLSFWLQLFFNPSFLDMTIESKARSCHLSSVNPYLELQKYLNAPKGRRAARSSDSSTTLLRARDRPVGNIEPLRGGGS